MAERMIAVPRRPEADPRFEIVRLWRERQIEWRAFQNDNRVIPDRQDVEAYTARRKEQRAGFGSEAVGLSEAMIAELLDARGVTNPYKKNVKGKVRYEGYNYLQDEAIIYPASDLDDQLRGADLLMLMADPDEIDQGSMFAIDVTVDPMAVSGKLMKDADRVWANNERPNRVYWYDTKAERPGQYYKEPAEGKVEAVNLTVFVPSGWAERYGSEQTSDDEAKKVMERLGPFALKQLRNEIEFLAMKRLGLVRMHSGQVEFVRVPTTSELIERLQEFEESPQGRGAYSPKAFRIALQNILNAEMENDQAFRIVRPDDEQLLPAVTHGFKGLQTGYADAAE